MGYLFKSLDAAATTGFGDALVFDTARNVAVNVQTTFTGAPSSVGGRLERSLDGISWDAVNGNYSADDNGHFTDFTYLAGPVLALRVVLTSISGGTSPTVTAIIAATER